MGLIAAKKKQNKIQNERKFLILFTILCTTWKANRFADLDNEGEKQICFQHILSY
jgi:hypothetical protein